MKLSPKVSSDFMRRAGWGFLAALFVFTGVGLGIYAFWQGTHTSNQPNYIQCGSGGKEPNQQPLNGKVKGAQLADFTPLGSKHITDLTCTDFKVGTGAQVTSSTQTLTVQYVGALASTGKIFDDSFDTGQPFSTQLNGVINGWSIGLLGMKAGGMRRLYIPSSYAYGNQSVAGIPAGSDLVFDIKLLSVK